MLTWDLRLYPNTSVHDCAWMVSRIYWSIKRINILQRTVCDDAPNAATNCSHNRRLTNSEERSKVPRTVCKPYVGIQAPKNKQITAVIIRFIEVDLDKGVDHLAEEGAIFHGRFGQEHATCRLL